MNKYWILLLALASCAGPQKQEEVLPTPIVLNRPVELPGQGSQIASNAKYETRVHGRIPVGDDMQLEAGTAHIRTAESEFKQAPAVPGFYVHTPNPVEDDRKVEALQNTANQQERLLKDALTAITAQNETLRKSNEKLEEELNKAGEVLSEFDSFKKEIADLKKQEAERQEREQERIQLQQAEQKKSLWQKLTGK